MRRMMSALLVAGLSGPVAVPATAAAEAAPKAPEATAPSPPTISHAPLRCVQAQEFPRVAAGIESAAALKRTRVYFKAHQHPDWYFVDMRRLETLQYLALLPQPLPETKQVDYYVQALDEQVQTAQTDTFDPEVSRGPCAIKPPKGWKGREEITIGGTKEGQPPIPPGFSRKGIVGFLAVSGALIAGSALAGGGSATAAGAATGSVSASAGGGSSTLLVVGGGVAAATAAGIGLALGLRDSESGPLEIRRTIEGVALTHVTEIGFSLANAEALSSITWSFGDGAGAAGPTTSHVYETEGTFAVTATGNDRDGGTRSATTTVQARTLTGTWRDQLAPSLGAGMELVQDGSSARGLIRMPRNVILEVNAALSHPRDVALAIRHPDCPTLELPATAVLRDTLAFVEVHFEKTGCGLYAWSHWQFVRP